MKTNAFATLIFLSMSICMSTSAHAGSEPNMIESGSSEEKSNGLAWSFTPDPSLPNVLILGDSISIGYTLKVRRRLAGIANVFRPLNNGDKTPANCVDTGKGVKSLSQWLGARHWNVIHFNFGLHDVKYLDETGKYVTSDKGRQVSPPKTYEENLRRIVDALKKTGASLIWCSTTPIPEGAQGRVKGDEGVYNDIAENVMKENGIAIDDLYSLMAPRCAELQKPHDVHFTEQGSDVQAEAVAGIIKNHLPAKTQ